jgi:hypothetical protein
MIDRLFDDTLWIYTSILGAVAGAAFLAYFKETKLGLWAYAKLDQGLDYLVAKFGWTWLEQPEDAWRKKYPKITHKIDQMEQKIKELENELAKK